ncbi:MAG: polyprenyl synthetase family protein [Clostridia bacterium]|nr:polyprenyl synthetase family protein [Clostridia bacterium]
MSTSYITAQERAAAEEMLREYAALLGETVTKIPTMAQGLRALSEDETLRTLWDAEQYSLTAGGKRIRGALVMETCRMLGGRDEHALPLACAIEMIHTFSLIHDDLPCMDNDDLRRGKPTNHKVYGEAIALLAGDGLMVDAMTLIAQSEALPIQMRLDAISTLAQATGSTGMVGGQLIDLESEGKDIPLEHLQLLHQRKTGALFRAALLLGAIAAGKSEEKDAAVFAALREYAAGVGLAFQVLDDILDVTADPALLGKTKGKDRAEEKNSFLKYYSISEAQALANDLTARAVEALMPLAGSERIRALAKYLQNRAY